MRIWLIALGVAAFGREAAACEATRAAFDQIKPGMSAEEVEKLVGCAGEALGDTETDGKKVTIRQWQGNGESGSNLTVTLVDGKLTEKAQSRLR